MKESHDQYAKSAAFSHNSEQEFFQFAERYFKHYYGQFFPTDNHAPILEIGCGQGRFVKILKDKGYENVYGIDLSPDQIVYGQEKLGLKDYVKQANALEFLSQVGKDNYDVIMLLDVLEHLPTDYSIQLLHRVHHSLKRRGRVLIQVPNGLALMTPQLYGDITHHRCYTVYSLQQSLILAGFSDILCKPQPPLVHGLKSWVRRLLWNMVINPLITFYMLVASGTTMGGIYTPDIYAIGTKR